MAREFPKIFQNRLGVNELLIESFLKEGSKPTVLVPLGETLRRIASVKMFVKIFLINSPYHSPDCAFSVTSVFTSTSETISTKSVGTQAVGRLECLQALS